VPDKGPLNGCVCVVYVIFLYFAIALPTLVTKMVAHEFLSFFVIGGYAYCTGKFYVYSA